ncbi:hypothetical protein PKHYL_29790 [Psychrobacter sp. KH172YL61]|nr:hypothetical protein PKHYL_29790 [Psychrobacter sp. KH172YL61]
MSNSVQTNHQSALSHLDGNGDITMVDVSGKTATTREANATGQVRFPSEIYAQIKAADGMTKKAALRKRHILPVLWLPNARMI